MPILPDPFNIIISGVGGQGNILASDLLSRTFCEDGYFVSVGETYGATQRGGSVMSHVRLSNRHLYGPLIPEGEAHIIIGFEPLEVLRMLQDYGHALVRVIMNNRPLYPLETLQKQVVYPPLEELISRIGALAAELKIVRATDLATKAGNPQAQNVVMVGAFAGLNWVPLEKERFLATLGETFSGERLELNNMAFELGFEAARENRGHPLR